ncbi:DUF4145 domain-containing protein [Mesorhizobium sp. 113-3-3]|uniref:DUF4145 domain-containing protein n=1 Tax=Mesorhizobium sp. 113-3-3 TaxID=2744516 RepID=UPI001925E7F1|nr:DUF4145 domain-containing protein [Mesorhizobium sp. 113-3-3]BCG81421.1 hypothetical protein MesoLj113b_49630 [Mesorhizobium sp. 113-3-3]
MATLPGTQTTQITSGLRDAPVEGDYTPKFRKTKFKCPRCPVIAAQTWTVPYKKEHKQFNQKLVALDEQISDLGISQCVACGGRSLWFEGTLVYPSQSGDHPIPQDLPPQLQKDFEEAAAVAAASPRAAAALLRMCIEGLCKFAAQKDNFNDAVYELEKQGVPTQITVAMDVVRMTGNEALHASRLYGTDDATTVSILFRLANSIVQWAITDKKQLEGLVAEIGSERFAKNAAARQRNAEKAARAGS